MTQNTTWDAGRMSREAKVAATMPAHEAAEMMRAARMRDMQIRESATSATVSVATPVVASGSENAPALAQ